MPKISRSMLSRPGLEPGTLRAKRSGAHSQRQDQEQGRASGQEHWRVRSASAQRGQLCRPLRCDGELVHLVRVHGKAARRVELAQALWALVVLGLLVLHQRGLIVEEAVAVEAEEDLVRTSR